MPCYTLTTKKANKREYHTWKTLGYTGSYNDYCLAKLGNEGSTIFMCGELGEHCADCGGVADILCDYPVGDGKTCDRPICEDDANLVGMDIHYCHHHYEEWRKFREAGGVEKELKNVVPFDGA